MSKINSKYLQFSAMLWQINDVKTGKLHSIHTSLVEASEIADELGKEFDVWFCANYNPIRKRKDKLMDELDKHTMIPLAIVIVLGGIAILGVMIYGIVSTV